MEGRDKPSPTAESGRFYRSIFETFEMKFYSYKAIWEKVTFHASKGKVLVTDKIEGYIQQHNIYEQDSETEMAKFLENRKNLHKWEIDFKAGFQIGS